MSAVDDAITLTSPGHETVAVFHPHANLLCSSLTHLGSQLLDTGRGLDAYAQRGKTMGIPLLYPWANRLSRPGYEAAGHDVILPAPDGRYPADPNGLPIHGALPGELRWAVVEHSGDRLRATLDWTGEGLLELFPFAHQVEVTAVVDAHGLELSTTVHADHDDAVPVSFGYHPYLTIAGSDRHGWEVDLGATERLVLDDRLIPTGERTPLTARDLLLGDHAFDDGLAGLTSPPQFLVSDGERALAVTFLSGYAWAQVYAPPAHDYICFEPMTAPTDALNSHTGLTVVAPGERYTAAFSITVTP